MAKIIKLDFEHITQIICPKCECPCWYAFKDLGHECVDCGYQDWKDDQENE